MMISIFQKLKGSSIGARAGRGAIWSFLEFGGTQFLRFASNLILTRLLFPEAFGLMALIQVILTGLELFSDTGINTSIVQHARGDDRSFLNSAWTIQVLRGVLLCGLTFVLAQPLAAFYDEPLLASMLPVASLSIFLMGFQPTSVATASRHLTLGKLAIIQLGVQVISILLTCYLAWQMQSVWALVIGTIISTVVRLIAFYLLLPGPLNRLHLEREAFWQIFHFGKWIFLSTGAGFLINQGDRAILGFYITLRELGIYNIAYMLASIPLMLLFTLQHKVVVPLYRMKPPQNNLANKAALFRTRRLLVFGLLCMTIVLSFLGPVIISALYDDRYIMAGPIITLYCLASIPALCLNSAGAALIGLGDSRGFFVITLATACVQTTLLILLIKTYGLIGAVIAPGLAALLTYPLKLQYARKYGVWDPLQDIGFSGLGLALCGGAYLVYADQIAMLVQGF